MIMTIVAFGRTLAGPLRGELALLMQVAGMPMGEPTVYQAFNVVTD